MDTGNRKSTLAAVTVAALIAAGQFPLAAGIAALYLVLNTVLHFVGRPGVDEGEV